MTLKLPHPDASAFGTPENRAESLKQLKRLAADSHNWLQSANLKLFYRLCEELAWIDRDSQDQAFDIYMQWALLDPDIRRRILPSREELRKNFEKFAELVREDNQGLPWDQRCSALTPKAVLFPNSC